MQEILIVGGGIAGLVLAISLKQQGLNPQIVEKEAVWTPKGSGIHLYSNALRALDTIGVAEKIAATGSTQDSYIYADPEDRFQVEVTYPRLAGKHLPALATLSRQALHDILIRTAGDLDVPLLLGTTVEQIDQTARDVEVTFSGGKQKRYDLLVGCDGINSQIRKDVFGNVAPIYTGQAIWRAMLERHTETKIPKIMYAGGGKMFGAVPINDHQIYLLAGMPDPEKPHHPETEFHTLIRKNFAEFGGLAPFYIEQIVDPKQVTYTAIEIVVQEPPWHRDRVFLIGDAAHASPPYLAQGAAMAIEDSVVLGELMGNCSDLEHIQKSFMERRFDRASFIQNLSLERNKQRYQGGSYDVMPGEKSDRIIELENNAQRQINELYSELAKPI